MSFFAGSYGRSWTGRTRRSAEVGDLGIGLREETFLAAFIVGFRLAPGIAGELEPYSFDDEEEELAMHRMEREAP